MDTKSPIFHFFLPAMFLLHPSAGLNLLLNLLHMNKTMFLDNQDAERLSASGADLSRLSQIADYPEARTDQSAFLALFNSLLDELQVEVEAEAASAPTDVGEPFPTISGPNSTSSRIAVVGAGPSGINMAYKLKKNGYNNVVVYEKSNRVGGKSDDVFYRGTHNTLSTYLVTPDYNETITKFILEEELGELIPWGTAIKADNELGSQPVNLLQLLLVREQLTLEAYFGLLGEYCSLHRRLFGTYQGELMPKPNATTLELLKGSFSDFLASNTLTKLASTFDFVLAVPGYARVTNLGALHALMWITPRYVARGVVGREVFVVNINSGQGGFTEIFRRMVQLEDIEVKFNHEVTDIRKRGSDTRISFLAQDAEFFDFVVWAGLPSDFANVAKASVLTRDDRKVLKRSFYKTSAASVVDVYGGVGRFATTEVYAANLPSDGTFRSNVHLSTDVYAETNGISPLNYATFNYTNFEGEPASTGRRTYSVANYGDKLEDYGDGVTLTQEELSPGEDAIRENIEMFFNQTYQPERVEVIRTVFHKYQPQWSIKDVGGGVHWTMFDIQGKNGVWIVGGGMSWDSTKSILEYNNLLWDRFQAGLDETRK